MKHVTTDKPMSGWDGDSNNWSVDNPDIVNQPSPAHSTGSLPINASPHGDLGDSPHYNGSRGYYPQSTYALSDAPTVKPSNFTMWVGSPNHAGGVEGCFHTYTRLSQGDAARPAPAAPLSSIPQWKTRFPHIAEVLENTESADVCPIIHFQSTISVMSSMPSQSSVLCTEFEVASSNPAYESYDWECVTRIYAPGKKVWELAHAVPATEELDGSKKLTLPFASDFWAAFYTGLSSAQQTDQAATVDRERLRRRRGKEARAAIKGITVVQELFSTALSSAGVKRRSAMFIWEFTKADPGSLIGKTTWRQIIPPVSPVPSGGNLASKTSTCSPDLSVEGDLKDWGQLPLSSFDPLSPMSLSSYYTMGPHVTNLFPTQEGQQNSSLEDVNFPFLQSSQSCTSTLPPFTAGLLSSTGTVMPDPSEYFTQWPQAFSPVSAVDHVDIDAGL